MTKWFLAAAAAACVSTAAVASISFNPATGTGFIGKGDVQSALGLNNPQLQALYLSGGIKFAFTENVNYKYVCTWIADDGQTEPVAKNKTIKVKREINVALNAQGRDNSSGKDGPNTGFFLNGYVGGAGGGTTSEPIPNLGDACDAGDGARPKPGTVTDVQVISNTGGELTVNGVHLWP